MKYALGILAGCLAVVSVALSVLLVGGFRLHREVRDANQKLQTELRAAQTRADTLQGEKQKMAADLAVAQGLSEALKARLQEIEAANTTAPAGPPPVIPPLRADAYLGQRWLGQAWVLARNIRVDTNTQRYVYEPVVSLDESLRDDFVVTNVVEREIATQTSYNYNNTYYPHPLYYFVNPSPRPRHGHSQPDWPPATPSTYPAPPAFNPGSGAVIPQKLGTPADQIKTRPQVVAQPPAAPTPSR